jgi:hypothetical protein
VGPHPVPDAPALHLKHPDAVPRHLKLPDHLAEPAPGGSTDLIRIKVAALQDPAPIAFAGLVDRLEIRLLLGVGLVFGGGRLGAGVGRRVRGVLEGVDVPGLGLERFPQVCYLGVLLFALHSHYVEVVYQLGVVLCLF